MNALSHIPVSGQNFLPTTAAHSAEILFSAVKEVLCFRVGKEYYGVDILDVQEIRSYEAPTRIHGAPDGTLGVLDLRGSIVPLLDARVRLGVAAGFDASTVTIVFSIDGRCVGLVVDQVANVHRLTQDAVRAAPAMVGSSQIGVTGLTSLADGSLLVLLDVRTFMGLPSTLS